MTKAQVKAKIREVAPSCSARWRDGEWRVAYLAGSDASREASAYYTQDDEDAIGTAMAMEQYA